MRIEIIYKKKPQQLTSTIITVDNVCGLEKTEFTIIVKQVRESSTYQSLTFTLSEIDRINIINL